MTCPTQVIEALGIPATMTVPGKVIVPYLKHQDTREALSADVVRINRALQDAGLLGRWRARTGGAHNKDFWILVLAQ